MRFPGLKQLHPAEAHRLVGDGAALIDVREMNEHRDERIPGSKNVPLSAIARGAPVEANGHPAVIYYCRSGARTTVYGNALAAAAGGECEVFVLAGGIDAWRAVGLDTERS